MVKEISWLIIRIYKILMCWLDVTQAFIMPATGKDKAGGSHILGQSRQLSKTISQNFKKGGAGDVAQCSLGSDPCTSHTPKKHCLEMTGHAVRTLQRMLGRGW